MVRRASRSSRGRCLARPGYQARRWSSGTPAGRLEGGHPVGVDRLVAVASAVDGHVQAEPAMLMIGDTVELAAQTAINWR